MNFAPPPPASRRRQPSGRLVAAGLALALLAATGYLLLADRSGPPAPQDAPSGRAGTAAPNAMLLFTLHCASCHQTSGEGVPAMFPPLAGSEWVTGDERMLANILLHGVEGEMSVKGVRYKGTMPAFWRLSDAELAAVATYARASWSNRAPPVSAELFATERARAARDKPFAGEAELRRVFARAR